MAQTAHVARRPRVYGYHVSTARVRAMADDLAYRLCVIVGGFIPIVLAAIAIFA